MKRPCVICHMMSTIDGKVASGIPGLSLFDNYFDLYLETEEKLNANNWLCGRKTVEEFTNFVPKNNPQGFMFVVDTRGVLKLSSNAVMLSNGTIEAELVVLVTKSTSKEYLKYLDEVKIKYLFGGDEKVNWEKVLEEIKEKYGVEKLLLEGGGHLNGSAMENNCVDEISLLITSQVSNSENSISLFDGNKSTDIRHEKFIIEGFERLDKDCLWIRYKRASQGD